MNSLTKFLDDYYQDRPQLIKPHKDTLLNEYPLGAYQPAIERLMQDQDDVLHILWQLLIEVQANTDPKKDILNKVLVEGAYNVLNNIGYTKARPRWERQ